MTLSKEIKKEIMYRSMHRGCKETDHLIGKFVESKINEFKDEELLLVRDFVLEDDLLIYDWIMGRGDCLDKYRELVAMMRDFHAIS